MAIYHLHTKAISRGAGQSAVAAAAYRRGERMQAEHTGETWNYRAKGDVLYSELAMPEDAPSWASALLERHAREPAAASEALWNRVELFEKRKDAQLAREIEIALPSELTLAQNIELVREFVGEQLVSRGLAADWSLHAGKNGNIHAHVLLTLRPLTEEGFGPKRVPVLDAAGQALRDAGGRIRYAFSNPWGCREDMLAIRAQWADYANLHLARAGHGVRIDHRSHAAAGIDVTPTVHLGPNVKGMDERGLAAERLDAFEEARAKGASEIAERPERVLELIAHRQAVFTRRDVAREINRYVDDAATFQAILDRVLASPELRELAPARGKSPARYSTREMVQAERAMLAGAQRLARAATHGVEGRHVEAALAAHPKLSEEQRAAVRHVTGREGLAAVAGAAGAGKSTMLAAAKAAWERQGYRVRGAALAGKAAEGLEEGSGIQSRTLASLEWAWAQGREKLSARDVLAIDEAGMIGSRQLGRVLAEASAAGAKVVLVGDARQLQPIEAGAPFRAITERAGLAEIGTIRRQKEDWARDASMAFARGDVKAGLAAYRARGQVRFEADRAAAKAAIARDWMAGRKEGETVIVLAHARADVRDLNEAIRAERAQAGELGAEASFATDRGRRDFAAGDRIVFLKNDRELGVKNGTLGTVEAAEANRLTVALDGGEAGQASVTVEAAAYAALDHGYAVTIHKAQGATVDRALVLASSSMDRHLAYVAMTRHREEATLYAGREEFADGGRLIAHGAAPYKNDPKNSPSYYVTLESGGKRHTLWGVDLERAMAAAKPAIGDGIALRYRGSESVRLPDGKEVQRHSWEVTAGGEGERLEKTLGRARLKESTLDFAERRGIDTPRDWIRDGRALLSRARARLEQAAARMAERFGLLSLDEEARRRRKEEERRREQEAAAARQDQATTEAQSAQALEAAWKAAVAAEFETVRDKARRLLMETGKKKEELAKRLAEMERAEPAAPRGFSSLIPGAKARHERQHADWSKKRREAEAALWRLRKRETALREYAAEGSCGYSSRGEQLAEKRAGRRQPELAAMVQAERDKAHRERLAKTLQRIEQQMQRECERGRERDGRGR
jgi:Ti-type conjugative transfer relaxase TraA